MRSIFVLIFMVGTLFLRAEGNFTGWREKQLELLSLFLPLKPVVLQAGTGGSLNFAKQWPECTLLSLDQWVQGNCIDQIDLISLNLYGTELQIVSSLSQLLAHARCIIVHSFLIPNPELISFLELSGFELFTQWEGKGSDAIFVKNNYFINDKTEEFLKTHTIDNQYKRYYEPFFKTYYDLDDDKDSIKEILKQGLPYEGNLGILIEELIRPGSLVLDIGSHIGLHTVTMSRKTGPQGGVLAFEPKSKFYMEMLNTLRINRCDNVIAICKALSDSSSHAWLSTDFHPCPQILRPDDHFSLAYQTDKEVTGEFVETIPLDSFNLKNLSLIKMDVENYEYFILKGAEETIKKNRPTIIFECWIGADYQRSNPKEKANFDRVMALLESYGYEVYVFFCNDFIAFPVEATGELASCKKRFKKLDVNNFDLNL